MEFDVLLMTRTRNDDYTWFFRPSYVDDSVSESVGPLLSAVENPGNRSVFESGVACNFFFCAKRNYCMLAWTYFTGRFDIGGRNIYALEGLACPKEKSGRFWRALPFLIQELYGSSLQELYMIFEETNARPFAQTSVELPLKEEELAWGTKELLDAFQGYDYSFLNMVAETRAADRMFSFLYGRDPYVFTGAAADRWYAMGDEKKEYREKEIFYAGFPEADCVRFSLIFQRKKDGYYWADIVCRDGKDQEVIRWEEGCLADFGDAFRLSELQEFQIIMEKKADRYGFVPVWRLRERLQEHRRMPMERREIWDEKHGLVFERISVSLDQCGVAACYRDEDERLFLQLYSHACRIWGYFHPEQADGRNTLYLLMRPSGMWLFLFQWQKPESGAEYWMEAIHVLPEHQNWAWTRLDVLINKYLLPQKEFYFGEFGEVISVFLSQTRERLLPSSFIVSVFPADFFPAMEHVEIVTGPGGGRKGPILFENPPKYERDSGGAYLYPPKGLARQWKIAEYGGAREKKISCIHKNGDGTYSCDAEDFFEECRRNIEYY